MLRQPFRAAMAFSATMYQSPLPLHTFGHRSKVAGCRRSSCLLKPLHMRYCREAHLGSTGGVSGTLARAIQRRSPHCPGTIFCAAAEETASTTGTDNPSKNPAPTSSPPPTSPKPSPFTIAPKIGKSARETLTPFTSARGAKSREAEKKLLASGSVRPTTSFGSKKLLDAFKEGDKFDTKVKIGQPKAPANIFTDSVRTAEEIEADKWVFRLDRGQSLLALSFFASSVLMFAKVWFVWKVGAIHFNEF